MTDDAELLRRYAGEKSEEAFAELVRRHLGLVYHAALRQCGGDTHRAEDVAQLVFTDLARKAAQLARRPVLAGWLYTSTRYAAAHAVRTEARRQAREQAVNAMNEIPAGFAPPAEAGPSAGWEQLRPVIDDALHALGERDREAVLLRFFEGRAFADVGAKLGASEDAARVRVDRALEKMRITLARHGVTSTSAALGLALAQQAGATVPASLAASVTSTALAGAATAGGSALVATFMSMTKLKIGIGAAVLFAGVAGVFLQRQDNAELRRDVATLRAQNRELTQLRTENERLAQAHSDDAAELTRLRADLAADKNRPPAVSLAPAAVPKSGIPTEKLSLAMGMKSATEFARTNHSTPRNALETLLSATNDGDSATLTGSFVLSPEARRQAGELFAHLSEAQRAQYGSPEQMLALLLAGSTPVAGVQVMNQHVGASGADFAPSAANDPSYQTLHVQRQYTDGRVREQDMIFHQTSDGWMWLPPAGVVAKMSEVLKPVPANFKHDSGG